MTVLGRRLDWRALVLLVVFLVVLAAAVPLILQGSRQPRGEGSVAPPLAASQPTPRTSPAVTPSSSTPSSATASPSTPPSSATPSRSAEFKLPNGWHMHHDDSGFSVPVPDGWSVSRRGSERWFRENGGSYRLLIIDQTSDPKSDPVADWRAQERVRRSGYRDYRLIGIRPASYWLAAADWEFLNTSDRGNRLHVLKRGFVTSDNQAYRIHWSTSADDWNANLDTLNIIFSGFRPAAHD